MEVTPCAPHRQRYPATPYEPRADLHVPFLFDSWSPTTYGSEGHGRAIPCLSANTSSSQRCTCVDVIGPVILQGIGERVSLQARNPTMGNCAHSCQLDAASRKMCLLLNDRLGCEHRPTDCSYQPPPVSGHAWIWLCCRITYRTLQDHNYMLLAV